LLLNKCNEQCKELEAIQRRAWQIILGGGKYNDNCATLELDRLNVRSQQQCQDLFVRVLNIAYIICCPLGATNQSYWPASIPFSAKKFLQLYTRTIIHLKTLSSAMDWLTFSTLTVL